MSMIYKNRLLLILLTAAVSGCEPPSGMSPEEHGRAVLHAYWPELARAEEAQRAQEIARDAMTPAINPFCVEHPYACSNGQPINSPPPPM